MFRFITNIMNRTVNPMVMMLNTAVLKRTTMQRKSKFCIHCVYHKVISSVINVSLKKFPEKNLVFTKRINLLNLVHAIIFNEPVYHTFSCKFESSLLDRNCSLLPESVLSKYFFWTRLVTHIYAIAYGR